MPGVDLSVHGYDSNPPAPCSASPPSASAASSPRSCGGSNRGEEGIGLTAGTAGSALPLPASYVPGTVTDTDWVVDAGRQPVGRQYAGATSSFEFEVNTQVQAAPPLPLWDAEPAVSLDGWRATVTMPAVPGGLSQPTLTVGSYATSTASQQPTTSVDLRRDEGSQPVVTFATSYADVRIEHSEGRTIYHQRVSTPTVGVADIALGADVTPRRAPSSGRTSASWPSSRAR